MDTSVHIAAELDRWPTKSEMASLLRSAGLAVTVGRYSIRLDDCSHFAFQEYGGDLGEPCVDADADTLDEMLSDAAPVSAALAAAGIRHRFEIYSATDTLVGYLHHDWPQVSDA